MTTKITSVSISNYGYGKPTGTFHLQAEGVSITYTLTPEDCEAIWAVCIRIAEGKKKAMAESILQMETPTLIGYDEKKTIDNEVPF